MTALAQSSWRVSDLSGCPMIRSALRYGCFRLEDPLLLLVSFIPLYCVRDMREGKLLSLFLSLSGLIASAVSKSCNCSCRALLCRLAASRESSSDSSFSSHPLHVGRVEFWVASRPLSVACPVLFLRSMFSRISSYTPYCTWAQFFCIFSSSCLTLTAYEPCTRFVSGACA